MFNKNRHFFNRRDDRSSALIITLAALVLLTAAILLFFQTATLNRQISYSSAGQYRANVMANTAMTTIEGDLRSEIAAGSTEVATSGGSNIYLPTTNLTVVPARVANQGFPNLIAQSASTSNFWSGANYSSTGPVRSAAANSSATASLNGRYISLGQWNQAGLLGDPGTGSSPQMTNNSPTTGSAYVPPDWVVVTRQGPITNATSMPSIAALADKSSTNQNFAVGRYAYTVYDEGGLVDANAVGVPSTLEGTTFASQRGVLPQVDLSNLLANLPTPDPNATADANALVAWRNAATASSASLYTNFMVNTTNGLMSVAGAGQTLTVTNNATGLATTYTVPAPGDQAFVSRRDLINYIKNNSSIPTAALQYLGTFTRDSDGPSYIPDPNRSPSPNGLAADNLINPSVLTVRVQQAFRRASDNTQAVVGEPLLKHRFPLSRLALFQNPTANKAAILQYFAMQQRSDGTWDYVDPDTQNVATTVLPTIKTLAQVATTTPGREPDFWEILQAGILTGSLGTVNPWNGHYPLTPLAPSATSGFNATITDQDASTTRHLLAIGLNIIDQYTPATSPPTPFVLNLGGFTPMTLPSTTMASRTSTPTDLVDSQEVPTTQTTVPKHILDMLPIISEENLPYIYYMGNYMFYDLRTPAASDANGASEQEVDDYIHFILWNPHRNARSAGAGQYRLACTGSTYTVGVNQYPKTATSPAGGPSTPGSFGTSQTINWGTATPTVALTFATSSSSSASSAPFNQPTILGASPGSITTSNGVNNIVAATPAPGVPNARFPTAFGSAYDVGLLLGQFLSYDPTPPQPPAPSAGPLAVNYGWYFNYVGSSGPNTFSPLYAFFGIPSTSAPLSMVLEVSVGGKWIPYQILPDLQYNDWGTLGETFGGQTPPVTGNFSTGFANGPNFFSAAGAGNSGGGGPSWAHADPRTMRFGLAGTVDYRSGGVQWSNGAQAVLEDDNQITALTGTSIGAGFNFFPLTDLPSTSTSTLVTLILPDFAYNLDPNVYPSAKTTSSGFHSYPDPDGVYRKGDNNPTSAETSGTLLHLTDSPYYINQGAPSTPNDALPVMLNRPFASVAELGYAFRDVPWRSLDFSSQNSADGALLDLFSLNQNNNSLRAGVLNLNSASVPVLTAILTGASTDPAYGGASNPTGMTTTPPLTPTQATTLATGIYSAIHPSNGTGLVLGNPADIPKLVAEIGTNSCYPAPTAAANYGPKFRRETVSRAFSDITNTRTWNLMIDVVAQSGRYANTSKSLNDFAVEGEKRYWVHLAIDRYTGEIVDSQIEPVSE